ncbi:MAG: hypothetical protein AAFX65_06060 [Cyanobacteria bacterium J06638_7]
MGNKLLLRLLAAHRRPGQQGVISVAAGVVAAVVLILSGAGVVALSSGSLRGVFGSSDSRQAKGAAVEGAALMIDTWNQPQNRRLMVSGADPATWNAANLRSPCLNTNDFTRPGPNGDGLPDAAAIALGDGAWRDVVSGAPADATTNGRQYRLVSIRYSASDGRAVPDPRALIRTATPGGGATGSALPSGFASWDELLNLDDPDGIGTEQPGGNSGFLVLEVEGRVVRGGRVVANSQLSQEFEVLPKCCGASLGSNESGGVNYQGTTGSLGSDGRLCNLQYGVVTGFNQGWHWSYFANDQFTQRNPTTGTIERYGPILGVVDNSSDLYERANCRVRPGRGKEASGNCPDTFEPGDPRGSDNSRNTDIRNAGVPTAAEQICRQPSNSFSYFSGPDTDIRGTSASCSPIVALEATAFPDIDDFLYTWTTGWGPSQLIAAAAAQPSKSLNVALWPLLSTDNGDGSGTGSTANSGATIRLRTNNEAGAERVEVCVVDQDDTTSADNCNASTWLNVTSRGAVDPNAQVTATALPSGNLDPLDSYTWPPSGSVDTTGLTTPYVQFFADRDGNWEADDYFEVAASYDNGATWYPFARLYENDISTSGSNRTIPLPFTSSSFRLRFRNRADRFDEEVKNISVNFIQSGRPGVTTHGFAGIGISPPWCEYTATSPITAEGGFHCVGPTINQFDGGTVFIDTSGGPLSLFYTEPATTDLRFGPNRVSSNPENFIYLSRDPADLAHVACGTILSECNVLIDDENYDFSPVGEPDRLNFFGRNTGSAGQEQNVLITTTFGNTAKIGGVWFYLPQGWVELSITGDGASAIPAGFYDQNEDNWSFFGRIWVKNFKPYGAFHLRVPDSRLTAGSLGEANPAQFVPWNGTDWVARATTNTRLW